MVAHVHSEVLVNGHEDAFEIYVPLAQPGAILSRGHLMTKLS